MNKKLTILGMTIIFSVFLVAMILSPVYRIIMIAVVTTMVVVLVVTWFSSRLNILYEHWEYRSNLRLNIYERQLGFEGMTRVINENPYTIKAIGPGKFQTHTPRAETMRALPASSVTDPGEHFPETIYIKDFRLSNRLDKMFLGLLGNGEMFYSDFTQWVHTVVIGTTGSGKSEFAHVILTQLLMAKDHVAVDLIDFASGTFVDYNIPFAQNVEEAEQVFQKWEIEFNRRRALFRETKLPNGLAVKNLEEYNMVADEPLPYAVMMLEEAGALYRDSDIVRGVLKDLLSQARKQGLHIFFMAQSVKAEHLPTDLRDLFQTKIQFSLNEKSLAGMLIPGVVPEDLYQPGLGIFYQGMGGTYKFQSPLVEEYRLNAKVEEGEGITVDPVIIDLAEETQHIDEAWPDAVGDTAREKMHNFADYLSESGQCLESVEPVEVVKHLRIARNGRNYDMWKEIIYSNGLAK